MNKGAESNQEELTSSIDSQETMASASLVGSTTTPSADSPNDHTDENMALRKALDEASGRGND